MKLNKNHLFIMMSFAMITWGSAWASAKIINSYLDYNNLVFLRFFAALITMFPLLFIESKFSPFSIDIITYLNIILVGFLFFLYNQCFFIATDLGNAGKGAVFVTTTNPIVTFLIISSLKKQLNYYDLFSIMFGIVGGLVVLDVFSLGFHSLNLKENIYFIYCSLIWGLMTVLMAKGQQKISSIHYIILTYFIATIISFIFVESEKIINSNVLNYEFMLHFFIVSFAMSIGTSIYIFSANQLGPVNSSVFIFSVPFIAMITAKFVLNEKIESNIVIGGVLSIVSIILINKKKYNIF